MSFCPKCHQTDKNFFAPQCHNCNEPVGFLEQCAHSLLVVAANIFGVIFGGWLLWQVLLAVF